MGEVDVSGKRASQTAVGVLDRSALSLATFDPEERTEARGPARIFRGLYDASTYIDLKRLPELFCGFPRVRSHGPTFYPIACSPQAWSATATLSLLRSCLGISFDPENDYAIFDQPVLPDFIDDLTLRQLTLGDGRIDVRIHRADAVAAVHVLAPRGATRALTRS